MDESTPGGMNGIHRKRTRRKALSNERHPSTTIRQASVPMAATTWAGMSTSGAWTGFTRRLINTPRRKIPSVQPKVGARSSGAGHGSRGVNSLHDVRTVQRMNR